MKKFITGSIAAVLAVAAMIPTMAMAASSTTQDDSPVPKSSYVEVSANSDTNAALTAEENATLNKAYDELELLFDELDTLYDDEGNLKSGSEQKAAELESRIEAIYDSIADIEEKAFFAELSASLSDEEIETLNKAYDELDALFDELDTLYDDEGNVKSGSEQKAAELESRIADLCASLSNEKMEIFTFTD